MTPRRRLILTGAACLAAGLAAGHYLVPPRTEIVQQRAEERVVYASSWDDREQWVMQREAATETHSVSVTERGPVVTTWPDGRREERGPERVTVATGTTATETTAAGGERESRGAEVQTVERVVEREVRVESQPDWLLGAQVGAGSVGVVYGAQVSRRVLGPIWLQAGALAGGGEWVATGGVGLAW